MITYDPDLDSADVQINTLYGLQNIASFYWLTKLNLILNTRTNKYCEFAITQTGYPYVTMSNGLNTNVWTKVTLHKILALARIHNGAYEEIEHIDDNPLNARVSNLKFSNHTANMRSAFINNHRDCPAAIFYLTYNNLNASGTMKEIQQKTGIPLGTLYDWYYKKNGRVTMLKAAPPIKHLSNRLIDYRKGNFKGEIMLDNLSICYE